MKRAGLLLLRGSEDAKRTVGDSLSCSSAWFSSFYVLHRGGRLYPFWRSVLYCRRLYWVFFSLTIQTPPWSSPSREAKRSLSSQEIIRISRKPEVYYCIHNDPPPFSILSQIIPVHSHPSHFLLKTHFNIIFPSTRRSSKLCLSLRFLHQNPVCTFLVFHTCYIPCPSHSSWFDRQKMMSTNHKAPCYVVFSTPLVSSSLLGPNILLSTLFSYNLSLRSSLNVSDQVSHPYKTTTKL